MLIVCKLSVRSGCVGPPLFLRRRRYINSHIIYPEFGRRIMHDRGENSPDPFTSCYTHTYFKQILSFCLKSFSGSSLVFTHHGWIEHRTSNIGLGRELALELRFIHRQPAAYCNLLPLSLAISYSNSIPPLRPFPHLERFIQCRGYSPQLRVQPVSKQGA